LDVFANDIKLKVYLIPNFQFMEVGMLIGIRDDGHRKFPVFGIEAGKASAVDRNGTLLNCYISDVGIKREIKNPKIESGVHPA
jgi:hypothetical protein